MAVTVSGTVAPCTDDGEVNDTVSVLAAVSVTAGPVYPAATDQANVSGVLPSKSSPRLSR